ncbi:MAG: SPOR domain-containing protein [Pseudomonadota bacterium]
MRDDSYLSSEVEAEDTASKWRGRAATAVGALVSVAILVGVVIWSYRLGVRDAAEIPVIRAELGATKQKPEEPGGLEVDYQTRAVYGVLSGDDGAEGGVALADAPEALTAEDVAPIERAPAPAPRPAQETASEPAAPAASAAAEPTREAPSTAPEATSPSDNATEGEATETAEGAPAPESPTSGEAETAEIAALVEDAIAEDALPEDDVANGLAPAISPIARPRPARATPQPVAATPAEAPEPRAAALASRIQIQLGAFVSQEVAEAQWAAIKSRNGDLLAGRGRVITPVLSGGRRLFRLRAGPFENVGEASALCRGLKARNEACIVARRES